MRYHSIAYSGVDDPHITQALERNKGLAALAGTIVVLVELRGDKHPVTLPTTPSALAVIDLAALAKSQHPDNLGPSTGSWQLQDPRVSEGDATVSTLRSAICNIFGRSLFLQMFSLILTKRFS